jgi:hypothetical protein
MLQLVRRATHPSLTSPPELFRPPPPPNPPAKSVCAKALVFKAYLKKTKSAEYIQCSLRTLSQRSDGNEKLTGMPGICRPQRCATNWNIVRVSLCTLPFQPPWPLTVKSSIASKESWKYFGILSGYGPDDHACNEIHLENFEWNVLVNTKRQFPL